LKRNSGRLLFAVQSEVFGQEDIKRDGAKRDRRVGLPVGARPEQTALLVIPSLRQIATHRVAAIAISNLLGSADDDQALFESHLPGLVLTQ
jgi:hypothetical protein